MKTNISAFIILKIRQNPKYEFKGEHAMRYYLQQIPTREHLLVGV